MRVRTVSEALRISSELILAARLRVEQHELAAVGRQQGIERGDDRAACSP